MDDNSGDNKIVGIAASTPGVRMKVLYAYAYWGERETIKCACEMIDVVGLFVAITDKGAVEQQVQIVYDGEITTLTHAQYHDFEKYHIVDVVTCPWDASVDRAMLGHRMKDLARHAKQIMESDLEEQESGSGDYRNN